MLPYPSRLETMIGHTEMISCLVRKVFDLVDWSSHVKKWACSIASMLSCFRAVHMVASQLLPTVAPCKRGLEAHGFSENGMQNRPRAPPRIGVAALRRPEAEYSYMNMGRDWALMGKVLDRRHPQRERESGCFQLLISLQTPGVCNVSYGCQKPAETLA